MTGAKNARNPAPKSREIRVTALSLDDAALLLSKSAGKPVTRDMIRADVEAGAPLNADGTINLVHYAAWLVKELADRGD